MKKMLRKFFVVITAVTVITCSLTIAASAASMDDIAKEISIGTEVECQFLGISSSANYFKINCGKGDLTINYTADQRLTAVSLYDSNGKEIAYTKAEATTGKVRNLAFEAVTLTKKTYVYWASKLKKAEGKIRYKVEKEGTYYIKVGGLGSSYSGSFTFSVDANSGSRADTISLLPVITLEVGDSIRLGAVITPANMEKVTYSYKNNGAISLNSNGKVNAKSVGESYVVIKSGSMKIKIKISVV